MGRKVKYGKEIKIEIIKRYLNFILKLTPNYLFF